MPVLGTTTTAPTTTTTSTRATITSTTPTTTYPTTITPTTSTPTTTTPTITTSKTPSSQTAARVTTEETTIPDKQTTHDPRMETTNRKPATPPTVMIPTAKRPTQATTIPPKNKLTGEYGIHFNGELVL